MWDLAEYKDSLQLNIEAFYQKHQTCKCVMSMHLPMFKQIQKIRWDSFGTREKTGKLDSPTVRDAYN